MSKKLTIEMNPAVVSQEQARPLELAGGFVVYVKGIMCKASRDIIAKNPKWYEDEALSLEMMAALIDGFEEGFTLQDGKTKVSKANLKQVLEENPWIVEYVFSFAADKGNFPLNP